MQTLSVARPVAADLAAPVGVEDQQGRLGGQISRDGRSTQAKDHVERAA